MTEPSSYSTMEWMMLCGCTTTQMSSTLTSKSHLASMTSSPLLTRVAESIVTLLPMSQFGFFSASETCIRAISSFVFPRNVPPEQVRRILRTLSLLSPFMHWKIALCSESTGRSFTPASFTAGMMRWPAVTSVSLFASAMSLPAWIAASVGRMPIMPTTLFKTMSASGSCTSSRRPSMPPRTFTFVSATLAFRSAAARSSNRQAIFGWYRRICSSIKETLLPAARAVTDSASPFLSTMSSACVPMDPVLPSMTRFFISFFLREGAPQQI